MKLRLLRLVYGVFALNLMTFSFSSKASQLIPPKVVKLTCKIKFKFASKLELAALEQLKPLVAKPKTMSVAAWAVKESLARIERIKAFDENFYSRYSMALGAVHKECSRLKAEIPYDVVATDLLRAVTLVWSPEYLNKFIEPRIFTLYLFSPKYTKSTIKTYFQTVNSLKGYHTVFTYRGNEYQKSAFYPSKFNAFGILLEGTMTHGSGKFVFANNVWTFYSEDPLKPLTMEFYESGIPKTGYLGKDVVMDFDFRRTQIPITGSVQFFRKGTIKEATVAHGNYDIYDQAGDLFHLKKGDRFQQKENDIRYILKTP